MCDVWSVRQWKLESLSSSLLCAFDLSMSWVNQRLLVSKELVCVSPYDRLNTVNNMLCILDVAQPSCSVPAVVQPSLRKICCFMISSCATVGSGLLLLGVS